MTTLMYERKAGGGRGHDDQLARLGQIARQMKVDGAPAWDNPIVRQRLAQLVIDAAALKYTRFRNLTRQLRGDPPGPEGSILKLFGSELGVRISDFAGELMGASSRRGSGHGSLLLARSDAQMSFGSPFRFDANSRLKPSAVSIGHPSLTPGLLTPFSPSATSLASPQAGANGQPCSLNSQP